jgi:hypothetical protein
VVFLFPICFRIVQLIYTRDLGSNLTKDDYERARHEKGVFKKFLEEHLFTEGTVMLLPGGNTDVSYRDEYSGFVKSMGHILRSTDKDSAALKNREGNGKDLDSGIQRSQSWEEALPCPSQVGRPRYPVFNTATDELLKVGQQLYHSRVTGKDEYQPISMMLLGAAGKRRVPCFS